MELFSAALVRLRWPALALLLVATAGLLPWVGPASVPNNALDVWFLKDDPVFVSYQEFQTTFGNDETVAVSLHDPDGVFSVENLALIHEASERLKRQPHIRGVTSLSTVLHIGWHHDEAEDDWVIDTERMFARPPTTAEEVARIRERIYDNPMYSDHIITEDGTATLMLVQPIALEDADKERPLVMAEVREVVDSVFRAAGKRVALGGMGVMYQELNDISNHDAQIFLTLATILITVMLTFTLRRLVAVGVALATMLISLLILIGIYGATGRQMNMVTMVLPTLLMIYGVADVVHVVNHYYQERRLLEGKGQDRQAVIVRSISYSLLPCLFTSVTTAAGFASLSGSQVAVIKDLGIFAGIGVLVAFVVSIIISVVAFSLFDLKPPKAGLDDADGVVGSVMTRLARGVTRQPWRVVAGAVLCAVVSAVGLQRLTVDTYTVQFLFEDNPVYRDHVEIESSFGNYMPMEFLVETHTTDGAQRPEVLRFVSQLAERVEGVENVSKVLALPAVVKRLNQAFQDGKEESYAIPDSPQAVRQELLFYDPDRADDPQRLVDRPYYRTCRLTARVKNLSARGWEKILDDVTAAAADLEPPPGVVVRPSGYLPMYVKQADYVVESLVESFAIAFVVVFCLIGVFTRSLRLALISIVPNCLPIAMVLGGMGLCGIRLDVATVVIAAVALGMVVDDTVHFLFRFQREMQSNGGDHVAAVEMALRTTGVALVGTSVTLCTGFVVFVGAGIKSIVFFGLLTGVTMLAALAGDLLLLPALLVLLRPKLR